jgi:hypothetical protein
MYVTTAYTQVPAARAQLIAGLADLTIFMCVAIADAADNPSWRSGGAIARATWERLLEEVDGDFPILKAYLGEVLSWWHEEQTPDVAYAQRPFPRASLPVIDSLSLLACGTASVVRGVQAKATYGAPRPSMHEALGKFEDLQAGEYDEFWAEAVRRLDIEIQAAGLPRFDMATVASGGSLRHFCVFISHGIPAAHDPATDYHPRVTADPPHGRAVALLFAPAFSDLVREVAEAVRARVLP